MRATGTVTALGRAIAVRELTVGEIRAWLAELETAGAGGDIIDLALLDDMALGELPRMTDLTAEEIDAAVPSELDVVLAKVREVNARFFALRAKLASLGAAALRPAADTTG